MPSFFCELLSVIQECIFQVNHFRLSNTSFRKEISMQVFFSLCIFLFFVFFSLDFRVTFRSIYCLVLLCLLNVFHNLPVYAGCHRTRCSGASGLYRDFRKSMDVLYVSSRLLARLTYRALNHTVSCML